MEKDGKDDGGKPTWLTEATNWAPEKYRQTKNFFAEVRSELKKVTWPSRAEVQNTTLVVIITTVFFGFYLYGLDILFSQLMRRVMGGSS